MSRGGWVGLVLVLLAAAIAFALDLFPDRGAATAPGASAPAGESIEDLYRARRSGVVVEGSGVVFKVLRDDLTGSRHQRFLIRLDSGRSLLVVHNIDLAERVEPLESGDRVAFRGQYEWNGEGGLVHWTHHDPQGRRPGGWLRRGDRTFR